MKKENIDDAITAAIAVLSETFAPASDIETSAKRFTTEQVAAAITELVGMVVQNNVVHEVLSAEGYRYVVDETSTRLKYVWLLNYR